MTEQASKTPTRQELEALMENACKLSEPGSSGTIMFGRPAVCFTDEALYRFVSEQLASLQAMLDETVRAYGVLQKQLEAAQGDARRYRFLTESKHIPWSHAVGFAFGADIGIDAAIAAQAGSNS